MESASNLRSYFRDVLAALPQTTAPYSLAITPILLIVVLYLYLTPNSLTVRTPISMLLKQLDPAKNLDCAFVNTEQVLLGSSPKKASPGSPWLAHYWQLL